MPDGFLPAQNVGTVRYSVKEPPSTFTEGSWLPVTCEEVRESWAEGKSNGEIAADWGCSVAAVKRRLKQMKLHPHPSRAPMRARDEIAGMSDAEAVEYLCGLVDYLRPSIADALALPLPGRMSTDRRIFAALWRARPRVLLRENLAASADTTPDAVRVHVCKLRKRIRSAGLPISVKTANGQGYYLVQTGPLPEDWPQ